MTGCSVHPCPAKGVSTRHQSHNASCYWHQWDQNILPYESQITSREVALMALLMLHSFNSRGRKKHSGCLGACLSHLLVFLLRDVFSRNESQAE